MEAAEFAAIALGAVLIGVGTLLVIAGFLIVNVVRSKPEPEGPVPQGDLWDFATELAKRVNTIYIPGLLLIVLGIVLVIVPITTDVLGSSGDDDTASSVRPLASIERTA